MAAPLPDAPKVHDTVAAAIYSHRDRWRSRPSPRPRSVTGRVASTDSRECSSPLRCVPLRCQRPFSPDTKQQYLYLADAGNGRVHIFDRQSMREVGGVGRIGHYAGQFVFLHNVAVDSKGNLYTAEVGTGRRAQKFRLLAR